MDISTSKLALAAASGGASDPLYVDDVFSTFVYEGNGTNPRNIENGIDLAGEGGLVWVKARSLNEDHIWVDTERGAGNYLWSNSSNAEVTNGGAVIGFNNNGFQVDNNGYVNGSNNTYASWTFRKAPGFFDVVTFTGNPSLEQQISHSLGSRPGMVIVKRTDSTTNWPVWHVKGDYDPAEHKHGFLNSTTDFNNYGRFNNAVDQTTYVTDSYFTVRDNANTNNATYVAYVFANDDARFGTNGDESIIKCGSYLGVGGGNSTTVDVGFEPQFLIIKKATASGDGWVIIDTMRGIVTGGADAQLNAESSGAELTGNVTCDLTPTGFISNGSQNDSATYIYMAIRRPHKPPTAATEVFALTTRNGNQTAGTFSTAGFPVDLAFISARNVGHWTSVFYRLRGPLRFLATQITNRDASYNNTLTGFDSNTAIEIGTDSSNLGVNRNSQTYVDFLFKRAPGFMDVVAYNGDGITGRTVNHNLEVVPEFMIVKRRSGSENWYIYHKEPGATKSANFNSSPFGSSGAWDDTTPTATTITLLGDNAVNGSGQTYVACLFATLPGISKVGNYSGNTGYDVNVDCGFTSGARFVLIKRTDSTGDWYVWDSARGIVSGNDPYLLVNSTNAEVTNTDYIDPLSSGFTVTSSAPVALNASGRTYIFLAIA